MSWLFSQALVVAYLEANSSGGEQSAQSKLSRSVVNDLPSDKTKDFYRPFPSGADLLNLSTGDPGEVLLTWFREASHARTSAQPILTLSDLRVRVQVSGKKCSASFAKLDRPTCLWRTHQGSAASVLISCSATWPAWGMMHDGECWELMTSMASTEENDCSLWATPTHRDFRSSNVSQETMDRNSRPLSEQMSLWPTPTSSTGGPNTGSHSVREEGHGNNLQGAVTLWPTCRATDGEKGGPNNKGSKGDLALPAAVSLWPTPTVTGNTNRKGASKNSGNGLKTELLIAFGETENSSSAETVKSAPLNPDFTEWLMGFPIGWSASAPLETHRFQQWLPPFGRSSPPP